MSDTLPTHEPGAPATGTRPCLCNPVPQHAYPGRAMDQGSVGCRHRAAQYLKGKSDLALRQALLRPGWKDILLIPQHWYPTDSPKFETEGWWYAPAEEALGRTCKSCRTFYEIENSAGAKRSRKSNVRCPKCQSENDQAKATEGDSDQGEEKRRGKREIAEKENNTVHTQTHTLFTHKHTHTRTHAHTHTHTRAIGCAAESKYKQVGSSE